MPDSSAPTPIPGGDREVRFEAILESFEAELRAGQLPSIPEWAEKHPEFAAEILTLFPGLLLMEHTAAQLVPATDLIRPRTQMGPYRIVRELGRGGMGVVYLAHDRELDRLVAVKVLGQVQAQNPAAIERLLREAQAAGRLSHSHIVPIYSWGQVDETPYIVMQYVQGFALDQLLDRVQAGEDSTAAKEATSFEQIVHGLEEPTLDSKLPNQETVRSLRPWSWREATRITREVGNALGHAHSFGILHRDVKPGNILIDTKGHALVTDFGLCQLEGGQPVTDHGTILGTLRYMAPEQIDGRAEERSDVYSLGLVLYELLTLRPAFGPLPKSKLMRAILTTDPVRPRKLCPGLPKDVETIVLKATAKLPSERYPSAGAMVRDLEAVDAGRPIAARPPSAMYLLGLFVRRQRLVTAVVLGSLCVIAALVAVYTLQLQRKEDLRAFGEYSARIGAAEAALQSGSIPRAQRQLEQVEPGRRGWEWYHLHAHSDQSLQALDLGGSYVRALDFSPDGKHLVVAGGFGFAWLSEHEGQFIIQQQWSASAADATCESNNASALISLLSGKIMRLSFDREQPLDELGQSVPDAQDSLLLARGDLILSNHQGQVYAFDPKTKVSRALIEGGPSIVSLWTPDGESVFALDQSGQWETLEGPSTQVPPSGPVGRNLYAGIPSPKGEGCYYLPYLGSITWQPGSTSEVQRALKHPANYQNVAQFSPDGTIVASAGNDRFVNLWNFQSGEPIRRLTGHSRKVISLAWNSKGTRLATGDEAGFLRIWQFTASGGRSLIGRHQSDVQAITISKDGAYALTCSREGLLCFWDWQERKVLREFWGAYEGVIRAEFLPGNQRCIVQLEDLTLQVWDLESGQMLFRRAQGNLPQRILTSLAVDHRRGVVFAKERTRADDGKWLTCITVLRASDWETIATWQWEQWTPNLFVLDETRQRLYLSTLQGPILVLDSLNGALLSTLESPLETSSLSQLALSEETQSLLALSWTEGVFLRKIQAGSPWQSLTYQGETVHSCGFLDRGRRIALGTRSGIVSIWDPIRMIQLADMGSLDDWVTTLATTSDGQTLLAGGADGSIEAFDTQSSRVAWAKRRKHNSTETGLAPIYDAAENAGAAAWELLQTGDPEALKACASLLYYMRNRRPDGAVLLGVQAAEQFYSAPASVALGSIEKALAFPLTPPEWKDPLCAMRWMCMQRTGAPWDSLLAVPVKMSEIKVLLKTEEKLASAKSR